MAAYFAADGAIEEGDRDAADVVDESADLAVPETVGRYHVRGVLGVGAVGVVLRAFDPELGREVAIKLIHARHLEKPRLIERFVEEAKVAGGLQHPGIVPVLEFGRSGSGQPYFTMRVVEGESLAELLATRARSRADRDQFVRWFERVCATLAFAHAHGVVHCDLKPGNIMVGRFSEVQVMDWGFAAASGRASASPEPEEQATHARHRIVGTPAYMAPEQARGELQRISARTDVFALGSVLCEILTGAPAYRAGSRWETYLCAREAWLDDAFQRLETCSADPELVALARECLAPSPDDRPADAQVVHQRVSGYLTALADRALRSELAAAEAGARAHSERRMRRLTLALGLAVIAALSLVAVYWSAEAGRRVKEFEVMQRVSALFDRAVIARDRLVESEDSRPAQWEPAIAAVDAAWQLAQAEGLEERFAPLAAELDRDLRGGRDRVVRELRLLDRLDAIRPHFGTIEDDPDRDLDAEYREAFEAFGLAIDGESAQRDASLMQLRGSRAARSIATALDDWAWYRGRRSEPEASPSGDLLACASLVDPQPTRLAIREAFAARDLARLQGIFVEAEHETWDAETFDLLGRSFVLLGDHTAAVRVYEQGYIRWPTDFQILHNLGSALGWSSDPPPHEIKRLRSMAAMVRPDSAHVWADLAGACLRLGELPEARAMAERAIGLDPEYGRAWGMLGSSLLERDPWLSAHLYRRAIDLGERSPRVWLPYATALYLVGGADRALEVATWCLEDSPHDSSVHEMVALACTDLGFVDRAIRHFERHLELSPTCGACQLNFGAALSQSGRFVESRNALLRGQELLGNSPLKEAIETGLQKVDDLQRRERELLEYLEGGEEQIGSGQRHQLALTAASTDRPLTAVRLFADESEWSGPLTPARLYSLRIAVESAAAAGLGEGSDADLGDPAARGRARELALQWGELLLRNTRRLIDAGEVPPIAVRRLMARLLAGPALAAYRDGQAAELSPETRAAWAGFCTEAASIRESLPDRPEGFAFLDPWTIEPR